MPPCPRSSHLMSSGSLWFLTNQRGLHRCLDLLQKGIPCCEPDSSLPALHMACYRDWSPIPEGGTCCLQNPDFHQVLVAPRLS